MMRCPKCNSRLYKEGADRNGDVTWALRCRNSECNWFKHLGREAEDPNKDINEIATFLKIAVPRDWGFVFVAIPPEKDCNGDQPYISNLEREGAVRLMRHTADMLEAGETRNI